MTCCTYFQANDAHSFVRVWTFFFFNVREYLSFEIRFDEMLMHLRSFRFYKEDLMSRFASSQGNHYARRLICNTRRATVVEINIEPNLSHHTI